VGRERVSDACGGVIAEDKTTLLKGATQMYLLMIVLLMFVFPILSILAELFVFRSTAGIILLIGKWFVFWAVGVRLFTAGLRQALQPQFTAEKILGIKGSEQLIIVQELGFANLSMGMLGMLSILNGTWVLPAAIVGCLFVGLAGIRHIFSKERNPLENSAMLSNLIVSFVLITYLVLVVVP
jgi:hypothetical protein